MTLVSRIGDLVTAIKSTINGMEPKLVPTGGSAGQALLKASGSNFDSAWAKVNRTFGISIWCSGKPGDSERIGGGKAPYAFTINQANCRAEASVAATVSTIFIIRRGATQIGTVTFSIGATLGTVSISSSTISSGDYVTVSAPSTADATLADISILLVE